MALSGNVGLALAAGEPLRIGVSLDQSGNYRHLALMHQRAYELWRDEVNGRGGILGRPVELLIADDGGDPGKAAAIYTDLIEHHKVDLLLAPYSSELTIRIAPIVDGAGYPLLAAGASSDRIWEQGYTHIFGMMANASRYSDGMLRVASRGGLETLAIISAPDEFSIEASEGTIKWAPFMKLKLVAAKVLARENGDMSGLMRELKAMAPDLLVVTGHLEDAVAARRAMAEAGWQPRAFYATIGPSLPSWRESVGALAEGSFSTSQWEPVNSDVFPGASDFNARFHARFGVDPSYQAASAYAAGQILEAAIVSANSFDREKLTKVIQQLDTSSIFGRFAVGRNGMQAKRDAMIIQWQKGRKEIVWPTQLRTAEPVIGDKHP